MDDLGKVRKRLAARKRALDLEAPNHGYDSALAMAAQAGGLQDAIDVIDEAVAKRKSQGRVFKIDPKQRKPP